MASDAQVGESAARRYAVLRPYLDERQRRLVLAAEAAELGRGGITVVAQATGVHPDTVAKGVRELDGGAEPSGRVRKPGGGRKPATETDPGLGPALTALVDPQTRGSKGAIGYTKNCKVAVAPTPVKVVDTVGAGDTFNAGILAFLHEQAALSKSHIANLSEAEIRGALTLGAAAAAVTVSRAGANPPWRHEIG